MTHLGRSASPQMRALARDLLVIAAFGQMPDSYWLTDSRIARACKAIGWTPEHARAWAQTEAAKGYRR